MTSTASSEQEKHHKHTHIRTHNQVRSTYILVSVGGSFKFRNNLNSLKCFVFNYLAIKFN